MDVGLCMVVRDEAHQLADCLAPIIELFDQVVIVDTGSRDGTPRLLRERFGVEVLHRGLDERRCGCLCDPRRDGLARLSTPWVMLLDADERVARPTLERIRDMPDEPSVAGYFGRWLNRVAGESEFEDYKLFLFRNGLLPQGLVHDVVQLDIRSQGLHAAWLPGLEVLHLPEEKRLPAKADRYRRRLLCAIDLQPDFLRYHWFLGYMEYRAGHGQRAAELLSRAAGSCSSGFPVECLNSAMVLAELHAARHDEAALERTLAGARAFHQAVAGEFEVRVNFRLGPWFENAWDSLCQGRINQIRAYRFAC